MIEYRNLPSPPYKTPINDASGKIDKQWLLWFQTLWNRVGGAGGDSVYDLKRFDCAEADTAGLLQQAIDTTTNNTSVLENRIMGFVLANLPVQLEDDDYVETTPEVVFSSLAQKINDLLLDNLADVVVPTPSDNDGLFYQAASSSWVNKPATGTGNVVLATSPTLVTPILGNATANTVCLNTTLTSSTYTIDSAYNGNTASGFRHTNSSNGTSADTRLVLNNGTVASGLLLRGTAYSGSGTASSTTLFVGGLNNFYINVNGTLKMMLDTNGSWRSLGYAFGYGTGAGGTVTQLTSRTTGVTLNKAYGQITLVSAAGNPSAWTNFTVTNNMVLSTDTIVVNCVSSTDPYMTHVTKVSNGSFQIGFATMGGTTVDQPVFSFCVIKGATS